MRLGAIIKGYREQNELTIEDFATASGISKSYISIIESGRSDGSIAIPSEGTIQKAAKGMGMQYMELREILDEQSEPDDVDTSAVFSKIGTNEYLFDMVVALYTCASPDIKQRLIKYFTAEALRTLEKE